MDELRRKGLDKIGIGHGRPVGVGVGKDLGRQRDLGIVPGGFGDRGYGVFRM